MVQEYQVLCINKSNRTSVHERITHIGGQGWKITQQDAINKIETNQARFFTMSNNKKAYLIIATSQYGYKYLKTENDGAEPNNLLSLPECR